MSVSIHAPARGATTFFPTILFAEITVSIHAPARGATWITCLGESHSASFNPRAREGRDLQNAVTKHDEINRFNPRAREGRDFFSDIRR